MALAQVSSLSSQDPSLSVPIGLKAKCHPYLGFARDDVLGSQLYIICTINRYPNRLRSFTVTCPGEPHCPNPSPIGVLFGPQPCFYIKGLRRKWSIYIYMTKINKNYFVLSSWLPLPDLPLPSLYSLWPWGWRPLASMWTRRLWTRWITSTKRRLSI